ncbi:MAG TPA: hypothetical protein VFD95_13995 [Usitatibacter sp.]|jgi:hypothetical protein|nr:hypothetical protein [Usitatibacter sp.]
MKVRHWVPILALAIATLSGAAEAQLYAASARTMVEGRSDAIGGSLFAVNLSTGSASLIAPIRLNGDAPLGITGLAAHPTTGVIYAITSPLSRTNPLTLVTIDPLTGDARMIGALRRTCSDIAFNRAGILFAWLPNSGQVGVVNLETGAVTAIGTPGPGGPPAGLSIDANGVAYVTPRGATGTLDTVDIATGVVVTGPPLTGAPFPAAINSMTFTPGGLLVAVNSNAGSPAAARLVAINVATGVVANIGTLPDDTDGLTFASNPQQKVSEPTDWRSIALMALGAIALILGLIGWASGRRKS